MLGLRRAAFRLLSSSPSKPFLARPRSITTAPPSSLRIKQQFNASAFQRRWATNEASPLDETTVMEEEGSPREDAEAAGHGESGEAATEAAATESHPDLGQSAEEAEAASGFAPAHRESPQVEDAEPHSFTESISNAADNVRERVRDTAAGAASALGSAVGAGTSRGPYARQMTPTEPKKTVYVGNLFFDVTGDDLKQEFSRFGQVQSSRLIVDSRGLSKGFGYIMFDSVDSASKAVENMNQQVYEGRRVSVQFASRDEGATSPFNRRGPNPGRPSNPPSKTLFIGNMSFEMTDRDLNNLFKDIRNVIDVRVAIDRRTGQPRGFAHADFIDTPSAEAAREVLQSKEIYGRTLRVDYSFGSTEKPPRASRDVDP